ncbi:hypothetical protein HN415_10385 [Candidatus Woesearchaeota archaeon]|jgi:hypothetical protein|nr:hypothetical protein [Candidatus Woesearchaeota archaeon]
MHEEEEKLADVHPEHTFKTNTGKEIKNLRQLLKVLNEISQESFEHHVKDGKNDFAKWIRHSVKDDELADMIERTIDFDKSKQIIGDRIALLEKKIEVKNIKQSLEDLKADTDDSIGIGEIATDMESPEEYHQDDFEGLKMEHDLETDEIKVGGEDLVPVHKELQGEDMPEPEMPEPEVENTSTSEENNSKPAELELPVQENNSPMAQPSPFKNEHHPFEHIKRGMPMAIRNILIGVIIGLIIGYLIGAYL